MRFGKKVGLTFALFFLSALSTNTAMAAEEGGWSKTNLSSTKVSTAETSPWGVLVGEYDTRLWLNPFNGIYISRDLGFSWVNLGLNQRGVTDVSYNDNGIYAATYYWVNNQNGLFFSKDGGKTWTHGGGNFSAAAVSAYKNIVLLGGFSHGLWVSRDGGQNFSQSMGDGFYGPRIYTTEITEGTALAALASTTYISKDNGVTWTQINSLNGKNVRYIEIDGSQIWISSAQGVFRSQDGGGSFKFVSELGTEASGAINSYNGKTYFGVKNGQTQKFDVLEFSPQTGNFSSTAFNFSATEGNVSGLTWLFSKPSYLFATTPQSGVFGYKIPARAVPAEPFLQTPWKTARPNELMEKIYSFFDHEYPLLGYATNPEPGDVENTTVNFLGEEGAQPHIYYSSHDGYDFALVEGTEVLAAASGLARYEWNPSGLGHTIKIDHPNGYQSIYGHLQAESLITTSNPVSVTTGGVIGKVGMSGNTTGPHLHFTILKDVDDDGVFSDNSPDGKMDPFAWLSFENNFPLREDPWEGYSWTDPNGSHSGIKSYYLWTTFINDNAQYIYGQQNSVSLDNKKVTVAQGSFPKNSTVFITPYAVPRLPESQKELTYIDGTSFLITALDNLGGILSLLDGSAWVEIGLSDTGLDAVDTDTLSIYYWDDILSLWESLPSIYDATTQIITGETNHFSNFAVFGKPKSAFKGKVIIENAQFQIM